MDVDVMRRRTDRSSVEALLRAGQLTRAELASTVGVSRPTASESVRRLTEAGLVEEAGRQEGGRGRSGTYCRLVDGVAAGLALHAGPGGVHGELVGPDGTVRAAASADLGQECTVAELRDALNTVTVDLEKRAGRVVTQRAVSVAHPVDVRRRAVVHLTGTPFLTDDGPIGDTIGDGADLDNDVHWAARAEVAARRGAALPAGHLVYLYLGEGVGSAIVDGGRLLGGHRGLAGEIMHLAVPGSAGAPSALGVALARLSGHTHATATLDVETMRRVMAQPEGCADIADLLGRALAATVTLVDPEVVVLGGPWAPAQGEDQALIEAVTQALRTHAPYPVPVTAALLGADAPAIGVRQRAGQLAARALLDLV